MAKKTLDDLNRLVKEAEAKREELRREISDLLKQKEARHAAAEDAARKGDVDTFMAEQTEEKRLDAVVYVKRALLDNGGTTLDPDEVMAAWSTYSADFGQELDKKWREYLLHRKNLYEEFKAIVNLQNEALRKRALCGELAGVNDTARYKMLTINEANPNPKYSRMQMQMPDAVFFLCCGDATEQDADLFNWVVRMKQAF